MLVYNILVDLVDDYLTIGKSTAIICVKCFVVIIVQVFGSTYFRYPTLKTWLGFRSEQGSRVCIYAWLN
jgi:hypothetical protein